ncbi:AAA family ATPase [Paenibacillus sp. J5C_2022]|uniref:AAA family ATPase n=1 Tax=Paenibacillus sp. J5C2022 TaxID=2977129 RepID=UPI0021D27225|nr:AAA family ATPase [Paenibacillus sp. J5C2022]MCU6709532.1 AAA family ATPase [Paenibacillus sp. J5C2022]
MRIVSAEVDGFGSMTGQALDTDGSVVIVYGPNEAGKSTLYHFIRTMLYGFPRRSVPEWHEPLYGGRHGGRLRFRDANGAIFVVERHSDKRGGLPYIRCVSEPTDGQAAAQGRWMVDQKEWERTYLGSVNERLYRQQFAITLTELQNVHALSGEELGQYLYQAGWGGGNEIESGLKRLRGERELLFKPRGTTQRMTAEARQLEQLRAELRAGGNAIDRYNELTGESMRVQARLEELQTAIPSAERELKLAARACAGHSLWLGCRRLEEERGQLAAAGRLPEGAAGSWKELQNGWNEVCESAFRLEREAEWLQHKRNGLIIDERLLAAEEEAAALLLGAERMSMLRVHRTEWQAELQGLDETIASLMLGISTEWTERQLRELHVSIGDRDDVRSRREWQHNMQLEEERLGAEVRSYGEQAIEAEEELEQASRLLNRAKERCEAMIEGEARLLPLNEEQLRLAWHGLEEAIREYELDVVRSGSLHREAGEQGKADSGKLRLPLWGGAAASAAAVGAAASSTAGLGGEWTVLVAIIAGVISLALLALAGRSSGRGRRHSSPAYPSRGRVRSRSGHNDSGRQSTEQDALEAALKAIVRHPDTVVFGLEKSADRADALSRIRTALQSAVRSRMEALQEHQLQQGRCEELEARRTRIRRMLSVRREELQALQTKRESADAEWKRWLADHSLPSSLTPTAALEAFELTERAMQQLRHYDRLEAKLAQADEELRAYQHKAERICSLSEQARKQLDTDGIVALRVLKSEIEAHGVARKQAYAWQGEEQRLRMELSALDARKEEIRADKEAIMKSAAVDGEEAYAVLLERQERLWQLDGEYDALKLELTAGLPEQRFAELQQLWLQHDKDSLADLREDARLRVESLQREEKGLHEASGRLQQEIHGLGLADRSELQTRLSMSQARLDADAERYAILALGIALIEGTKSIYEEERQPSVLRRASSYMAELTEGRYRTVMLPVEGNGLVLVGEDQREIPSDALSRGTAEQLYLAMRLALLQESAKHGRLPLLLDDPFVNFDRARMRAAARLMDGLSADRQIILFTCHEHVRDEWLSVCKGARLVERQAIRRGDALSACE